MNTWAVALLPLVGVVLGAGLQFLLSRAVTRAFPELRYNPSAQLPNKFTTWVTHARTLGIDVDV